MSSWLKSLGLKSTGLKCPSTKIEDIEIDDNIDIIVSEWMGYCLLYELMLPSVIFARDKYKPDIMIPGQAAVLICGFFDEKYFEVSEIALKFISNQALL